MVLMVDGLDERGRKELAGIVSWAQERVERSEEYKMCRMRRLEPRPPRPPADSQLEKKIDGLLVSIRQQEEELASLVDSAASLEEWRRNEERRTRLEQELVAMKQSQVLLAAQLDQEKRAGENKREDNEDEDETEAEAVMIR